MVRPAIPILRPSATGANRALTYNPECLARRSSMPKPLLRLVRDEPPPAVSGSEAGEAVDVAAEYRRALLLLEISDYERSHGPNDYTRYVRKYRKRPPAAEARAMALVMGKRVKAADGRWYPKKSVAEREFDRQRKRRQEEFAETSRASRAVFEAVSAISALKTLPEDLEILSWHAREIEMGLDVAIEWLKRFAAVRSSRDESARSQKSSSSGYRASRPSA